MTALKLLLDKNCKISLDGGENPQRETARLARRISTRQPAQAEPH